MKIAGSAEIGTFTEACTEHYLSVSVVIFIDYVDVELIGASVRYELIMKM